MYTISKMGIFDLLKARKIFRSHLVKNGWFFKSMSYAPDLFTMFSTYVAKDGDRLIGYIYVKVNRELHSIEKTYSYHNYSNDNLYISCIDVDTEYHGKDVAKEMLDYVIDKYNKKNIYLHIREDNYRSQVFHTRYGFSRVGEVSLPKFTSYMYVKLT